MYKYIMIYAFIYIHKTDSKTCMKNLPMYHSAQNSVENKQSTDTKAEALHKYLELAEEKEKSLFMGKFDWEKIRKEVKDAYKTKCIKKSNGSTHYKYDYSYKYVLRVMVQVTKGTKIGDSKKKTLMSLIQQLTTANSIDEYVTTSGSGYSFKIPDIDYVKYENPKCNNVTISTVSIGNFSVTDSRSAAEDIIINFNGVSVQHPYMDSDKFPDCINKIVESCKTSNSFISTIRKTLTGNCDHASMSLMAEVVTPPNSYLNIIGNFSIKDDVNTRLFYECMLENNPDCSNYVSLAADTAAQATKILSSYMYTKGNRHKRDTGEIPLDSEDLECMYEAYEPYREGTEYTECVNSKKAEIAKSRKKRTIVPSINTDTDDETKMMARYLGVDGQVIPDRVSHIQTGIHGGSENDGIIGDGQLISRLSLQARQAFAPYMPSVPLDTDPYSIRDVLRTSTSNLPPPSKNPVIAGVYSVATNKVNSVLSALSDDNRHKTVIKEYLTEGDGITKQSKALHGDVKTSYSSKKIVSSSIFDTMKEKIRDFRDTGGEVLLTKYNQRQSSLMFNVDTSTSIVKPRRHSIESSMKEFGRRIDSLTMETIQENNFDSLRRTKSTNSIEDCGKFGNTAACALLGRVPDMGKNNNNNVKHNTAVNILIDKLRNSKTPLRVPKIPISTSILGRSGIKHTVSHVTFSDESKIDNHERSRQYVRQGSTRSRVSWISNSDIDDIDSSLYGRSRTYSGGTRSNRLRSESGYQGDTSRSDMEGSVYQPSIKELDIKSKKVYREKMIETAKKFDKTAALTSATQLIVQGMISARIRNENFKNVDFNEAETIFEAVSASFSSVGNAMLSAGIIASPTVAFAGMGLSFISGLLDLGNHLYQLITGKPKPEDPLVKKFNQYNELVSDSTRMGVRTCLMPGSDLVIYLAYRNDSSFKPSLEKLNLHFIDVPESIVYYLNTSNIIMDYSLTIACPIGYLRSPDLDVNAFVTLKDVTEEVRFYQVTRLGAMLSKSPIVRFTCGREVTLTLKPFEIPLSNMQLLKMATPGEPEESKSMPSNVCDLFPLKNFYLLVKGCPFDNSKVAIAYTTCSVLLRMSIWEEENRRWLLENPFDNKNRFKQLFTFNRFNFNDTVIKPNEISGHAKFCANRQSNHCHWFDVMVLDDISSCENRVRKIYVEIYLFSGSRGFTSFVLTCPSGSTPVAVGNKDGIIELPFSDLFTVKMFASVKKTNIGVFCVNDYDTRYRSDMIILKFVEPNFPKDVLPLDTYDGQNKLFNELVYNHMPWRSRTCSNIVGSKSCISFHGRIDIWNPNYVVDTEIGSEIMITEKYDPDIATLSSISKSSHYFPYKLQLKYSLSGLGKVYDTADRFWQDAKKKFRTFSSMLIVLVPCNMIQNIIKYHSQRISILQYQQALTNKYGDGKKYVFTTLSGSKCTAELDLTTKLLSLQCEEFSLPRSTLPQYEGICSITISSKDHCGTTLDSSKYRGYSSSHANTPRRCDMYKYPSISMYVPDNYCGYGSLYGTYYPPQYEACKSYIHIYYSDTWIEKEILDEPPYAFNFKYDTSKNEYIDSTISGKLRGLYQAYKELYEYTDGTLPKSINRLAGALSDKGRDIASVNIDSSVLEVAYLADMEKMAQLEEKIKDLSKEVLISTLSDNDLYEIIMKEQYGMCCLLDFKLNTSTKVYPNCNYTCGTLDDFIYEEDTGNTTEITVLINGTHMDYDMFSVSEASVVTCLDDNVIPLSIGSARSEVEKNILLYSIELGLGSLMEELDYNISSIMLSNNITYID
ncbi:VARV Bangladesh B22R orthologue [Fowlpox virus isolate HP-438/Munich]|uniref:VARV Bangladesh B22R orthologue n=1 Tax=Fowlpox virus TaxID=10261 RepID=Q70H48_FOWPV|nr:variola B22R gene family protein [Fowlpox virus]URH28491.1 variola B22R gene family protein [Fowlpox virus]URH28750.1 variola B22R gene family protein [Fowlpox virus]CAE52648.1 VARV Bangladesh B22R orthologue [Fowlpox virus isolate HP-438/Munich]